MPARVLALPANPSLGPDPTRQVSKDELLKVLVYGEQEKLWAKVTSPAVHHHGVQTTIECSAYLSASLDLFHLADGAGVEGFDKEFLDVADLSLRLDAVVSMIDDIDIMPALSIAEAGALVLSTKEAAVRSGAMPEAAFALEDEAFLDIKLAVGGDQSSVVFKDIIEGQLCMHDLKVVS